MQSPLPPPYYGTHFSDPSLQTSFIISPPNTSISPLNSSPLTSPTSNASLEAHQESKTQTVAQKWFGLGKNSSTLDWNWREEKQPEFRKEWAKPNFQN